MIEGHPPTPHKHRSSLGILYAMGFFMVIHLVLPLYINSTFLEEFTTKSNVGFIYTIASVLTLIAFFILPALLQKLGAFKSILLFVLLDMVMLLGLAFSRALVPVMLFFFGYFLLSTLIRYVMDIFVERHSDDKTTGQIRGVYLTTMNIAYVVGPVMAGYLLGDTLYERVYIASAIALIPFLIFLFRAFRNFRDVVYKKMSLRSEFVALARDKDLRSIIVSNLYLQLFFAVMVVYMPIYLHEFIGYSFETIGLLFTIMLSAYLLFEYPLGRLADTRYGEKEILSLGYIVVALATIMIALTRLDVVIVWALLLFGTRVGCAMIESMNETYFFKHIESSDADDLSAYRMTQPVAYVIAPLAGGAILYFLPFPALFLAVGLFMLTGLFFSLRIRDTR